MPPLNRCSDPFWIFHVEPAHQETLPKKSVQFASHAQQYPVLDRANYSLQEMENSWYAKPDFVEFAMDIRQTVAIIETQRTELLDDVNYTTRGSICRKEGTAKRRKQVREGAKDCVLNAQYLSRRDAEYISAVYIQYSQPSSQEALMQGSRDHDNAKLLHSSQPVEDFLNSYFSDDWITHSDDGSSASAASSLVVTDSLISLETPESLIARVVTPGFDDSWLCGPAAEEHIARAIP